MKEKNLDQYLSQAPVPSTFTLETCFVTSRESGKQVLAAKLTGEPGEALYEIFDSVTWPRSPGSRD